MTWGRRKPPPSQAEVIDFSLHLVVMCHSSVQEGKEPDERIRHCGLSRRRGDRSDCRRRLTPSTSAPPPDPGFRYIFDGSATGSDASFDKWAFAAGNRGTVAPGVRGRPGPGDTRPGRGLVPRRRVAVRRLLVPGQAVRRRGVPDSVHGPEHADLDPQRRRHDPHARGPLHGREHRRGPGPEADRLQLRSLRGRAADLRPRHARRVDDATPGPARAVRSRRRRTPRTRRSRTRAPTAHATAPRTSPTWPEPAR